MLPAANGKPLYCACLIFMRRSGPETKEVYFHAANQHEAVQHVKATYPNRNRVQITAVGPAIGVFAANEKALESGEGTFKV